MVLSHWRYKKQALVYFYGIKIGLFVVSQVKTGNQAFNKQDIEMYQEEIAAEMVKEIEDSSSLRSVVTKMLSKDPGMRPSMEEVRQCFMVNLTSINF